MRAVLTVHGERQPPFLNREPDPVGSGIAVGIRTLRREVIALDQVEDRDPPLLLDIGRSPQDRVFVEGHGDDARIGHLASRSEGGGRVQSRA